MDRHGLKDGQLGDGDKVVVEYALIWEYNENAVVLNFDKNMAEEN